MPTEPERVVNAGDNLTLARARAAVLADLRCRRLLKELFAESADDDPIPVGYVDGPIDNASQDRIAEGLVLAVLQAIRDPSPGMEARAEEAMFVLSDQEGTDYPGDARVCWQAMINAALEEGGYSMGEGE